MIAYSKIANRPYMHRAFVGVSPLVKFLARLRGYEDEELSSYGSRRCRRKPGDARTTTHLETSRSKDLFPWRGVDPALRERLHLEAVFCRGVCPI